MRNLGSLMASIVLGGALFAAGCGKSEPPAAPTTPTTPAVASPSAAASPAATTAPSPAASPAASPSASATPGAVASPSATPAAASPAATTAAASPSTEAPPAASASPAATTAPSGLALDNFHLSTTKDGPAATAFKTGDAVHAVFDINGVNVTNGNASLVAYMKVEDNAGKTLAEKKLAEVTKPWTAGKAFHSDFELNKSVKGGDFFVTIRVVDNNAKTESSKKVELKVE